MSRPLAERVALVTGAGRGLGAALADTLAAAGAVVAVADFRAELAQARAERIAKRGERVSHHVADIGDAVAAERCVREVIERHGRLDVLVNNAGADFTLPIDELTVEQWDRVVATNLRGPFLLSRAVVPHMKQRGGGHIVTIASTAAKRAWPNASAYHASKWGVLGLSHALHAELRPHGIKVTAVIAGGMRTPFLLDRFPDLDPNLLQDPQLVARAVCDVLAIPGDTVIPEITVLPMRETSWP